MIISLTFENWKSYSDSNTFSMEARGKHDHVDRIHTISSANLKLLPIAAVFGGNASGKSNFVKALKFVQDFIVDGKLSGNGGTVDYFMLNKKYQNLPTKFSLKLLIDESVYDYEFAFDRNSIISESLSESSDREVKNIFKIEEDKITIDKQVGIMRKIRYLYDIKDNNELFLTFICKHFKVDMPVYNWFENDLQILFPKSGLDLENVFKDEILLQTMNKSLKTLDCGAMKIDFVEYTPNEKEFDNYMEVLKYKTVFFDPISMVFGKFGEDGYVFKKLVSFHLSNEKELVRFDINANSDGTIRMIDLLPAIIRLTKLKDSKVCVIDEIDQSLHFHMIKNLITAYLHNCYSDIRSQLIFTTHNVMIMDKSLFRIDEMWLSKRTKFGSTNLFPVDNFADADSEKNIRNTYLDGRLGGVPNMLLIEDQIKYPSFNDEKEFD